MSTRILAIDTATEACSVASSGITSKSTPCLSLCPLIYTYFTLWQQVLAESGLALNQLDAPSHCSPAVLLGCIASASLRPGAFADLPMIGVSTLQPWRSAWRVSGAARAMAIDARNGEGLLG